MNNDNEKKCFLSGFFNELIENVADGINNPMNTGFAAMHGQRVNIDVDPILPYDKVVNMKLFNVIESSHMVDVNVIPSDSDAPVTGIYISGMRSESTIPEYVRRVDKDGVYTSEMKRKFSFE